MLLYIYVFYSRETKLCYYVVYQNQIAQLMPRQPGYRFTNHALVTFDTLYSTLTQWRTVLIELSSINKVSFHYCIKAGESRQSRDFVIVLNNCLFVPRTMPIAVYCTFH